MVHCSLQIGRGTRLDEQEGQAQSELGQGGFHHAHHEIAVCRWAGEEEWMTKRSRARTNESGETEHGSQGKDTQKDQSIGKTPITFPLEDWTILMRSQVPMLELERYNAAVVCFGDEWYT